MVISGSLHRIEELRAEAGTVFLVTHSSQVVRETCNRAIWLEQGKIIMDGDVSTVVDAYDADVQKAMDSGNDRQAGAARN